MSNSDHSRDPAGGLSRRSVIAGATAAAALASAPFAFAVRQQARIGAVRGQSLTGPVRRYMAATVMLPSGKLLVTGGYDRPWNGGRAPLPSRSAFLYDPESDVWEAVGEMNVARARHAAAVLSDGRVTVLGGIGTQATASVEIYDPRTGEWEHAEPLSQPRYDHTATADGGIVYVLGGSGQSMLSSVEVLRPSTAGTYEEE